MATDITREEMADGLFAIGRKYLAIAESSRPHEPHEGLCEVDMAADLGTLACVLGSIVELVRDD